MSIHGTLDISTGGVLAATRLTTYEQGELTISGSSHLDRLTLQGAKAHVLAGGELHLERLLQTGGLLEVYGSLTVDNLQVTDGALRLRDKQSPYDVTARFQLSGQSELQLVVGDDSWNSPIRLAEGM